MKNKEIAKKLDEIANFLELDDVKYKPFAYRRASSSILSLNNELADIYAKEGKDGLEKITGIGKNIADKVEEILLTGEIEHLRSLKEKYKVDIKNLSKVQGIGYRSIKKLYENLGIETLQELENAARKGDISSLEGFGEKTEKNILEAVKFLKKDEGRWSLGEVLPIANEIFANLQNLDEVKRINFAGSLRRKKELVGDVDILISAGSTKGIMDTFTSFKNIAKITSKGDTKSSIRLQSGFDVDLRVVAENSFGAALQYFTGSKNHNIKIRKLAISKGYKLSEYGLFRNGKRIAGKDEKDIYQKLGLFYIPPELRENKGEIEEAVSNDFSDLCNLDDIKGDLHLHSTWSGGIDSIREIANYGEEMGYLYLGITDHTKALQVENGLDEGRLLKQSEEISCVNKEIQKQGMQIKILHGCEANILKDGSLDIENSVLAKLDYVIAGVHSYFDMGENEMTSRLKKAIEHPQVNIISHPTGRLIKKRKGLSLNFKTVLKAAKQNNVALEINSSPARLDLDDNHIRECIETGVKVVINTDSHDKTQMQNIIFGVGQARRGWATKKMVINTFKLDNLLSFFNEK